MKTCVFLALLLCASVASAQERPTLSITATEDNFEVYLPAEMVKKKVPAVVVTTEDGASLALKASAVETRKQSAFNVTLGSYVALRTVDFAQTSSCVFNGGCVELNPVFRSLVSRPALFTIAQAGMTTGITVALYKLHQRHPKLAWTMTAVLVGAQAVVVRSNAIQLGKGRR
jgi:uncharacterized protein DUF5658